MRQRDADLLHDRGLNAFARLVEQQQPRTRNERTRERQDLLLAARERTAAPVEQPRQPRKRIDHPLHRLCFALAVAGAPGQPQIVVGAQARQDAAALRHVGDAHAAAQVRGGVGHVDTVERDAPAARRQQADQRLQQRRLAHAVVADDADRLAFVHLQRHAVQHRHVAVAGAELGHVEHEVAVWGWLGGVVQRGLRITVHWARLPM